MDPLSLRVQTRGMAPQSGKAKGEKVQSKSPAEFFADNQNIAGFDNPGKSLYTTIREFVENSLDAAESIQVLPDVQVTVEEMSERSFNEMRGLAHKDRIDQGLFNRPTKGSKGGGSAASTKQNGGPSGEGEEASAQDGNETGKDKGKKKGVVNYYRVTCEDNGCGMDHEKIPDMFGRVLSGSKYGVRQTRGKFGLGSKMALIWSKKSTGMPIEITSAKSLDPSKPPAFVSHCVLDIDIYRNEPHVIKHTKTPNTDNWRGTKISVVVGGNWTTYRAKVLHYFQQLAIITPYAQFDFSYRNLAEPGRDVTARYCRRSDRVPPPAAEVKYHPKSVNNLVLQQLLKNTKSKNLVSFLTTELACVEKKVATRVVAELQAAVGDGIDEKTHPHDLDPQTTVRLVQLLRDVALFKAPDGSCLSPAGEYNLNLGVLKELNPDYVATRRENAAAFEGHPFIVEAAVSLGGKSIKEGIHVHRFANRIPLLFEAGSDVVTQVANKRIKWGLYKIDPRRDKISVFVSIVSTKIPFKGTGKEYIGDDIQEIQRAVKSAIQHCCQQLKKHVIARNAKREGKDRKKAMMRYVPDVTRALSAVINNMTKRPRGRDDDNDDEDRESPAKRRQRTYQQLEEVWKGSHLLAVRQDLAKKKKLDEELSQELEKAVERFDFESALEATAAQGTNADKKEAVFIAPFKMTTEVTASMTHPTTGATIRLLTATVLSINY